MIIKSPRISIVFTILLILVWSNGFSQMNTTTTSPMSAVQDILLGEGVEAFNFTYNGSPTTASQVQNNIRSFTASGNFPMSNGVVMSTNGQSINDPDLAAIASGSVTNGAIIEFDFIPTGDTLSFDYIFASAEYSSYTCSNYNDVFGFFISGPGISGPYTNNAKNLATVPNKPNVNVGVNTVNSGSAGFNNPTNCSNLDPTWQQNSIYWTASYNSSYSGSGLPSFNGSTVTLQAATTVICGEVYHIKMAISNITDTAFDSGVFLAANSFSSSTTIDVDISADFWYDDSLLIEGCTDASIHFTRSQNQASDTLIIYLSTEGTAIEGIDYPELIAGDSLILLPGQTSQTITIMPINDGIDEGVETIIINAYTINNCGDTITSSGIIYVDDKPKTVVTASDTTLFCWAEPIPLHADTENGFPPYTYTWDNGATGADILASADQNGTFNYIVKSTDSCGFEFYDTSVVVINQTLNIDQLNQIMSDCGESTGSASAVVSGITGTPIYTWTTNENISPNSVNTLDWTSIPTGWYYFSVVDEVCSSFDSVFVKQDTIIYPQFIGFDLEGCMPHEIMVQSITDYSEQTCLWDFGDGVTATGCDSIFHTYTTSGNYSVTLKIENSDGCKGALTIHNFANIFIKPTASFTANPINMNVLDTKTIFYNQSEHASSYEWDFGDLSALSYEYEPTHVYPNSGEGYYKVTLLAISDHDCMDTVSIYVEVNDLLLYYIPNSFTPDNDNYNEIFKPIFTAGFEPSDFTFTIYNRWGELLFESHDSDYGWDGTYGGKISPTGAYVWRIEFKEKMSDKRHNLLGSFTLLK